MSILTMDFDNHFEFKNKVFSVDMSYNNILLFFEMFDDPDLESFEKIFIALEMLVNECEELELESQEEAYELFKEILLEFLEINLDSEKTNEVKTYDFEKDAEIIYASFYSSYGIDLIEQRGKLHWKKFRSLLAFLDDKSMFKQIVGYRTMKIPSEKEVSKDYRDHVIKMKQAFSLDQEDDGVNDVSPVFDSLAEIFKGAQNIK